MGVEKGRGNPDKVINIMKDKLTDVDITLYTDEPRQFPLLIFRKIAELHNKLVSKELSADEYIKERSKIEWKRRNGIFKEMPDDYRYIPRSVKITD